MTNIDCPLQSNARVLNDHPALLCGERKLSYKEFNRAVWSVADYFQELGIKASDRVGIFAPNSIETIIAVYAIWRIGAVACIISTRLPEAALNAALKKIQARYLVTPLREILTSPLVTIKKINLNQSVEQIRSETETHRKSILTFTHNQDATIIFTSGSQGEPKAALHTFGNHFFSAKGANEHIPFNPEDRWLLSLPFNHVGGLSILFRVLLGKGTLVIPQAGEDLDQTITSQKVTHLSLVTTQLFRLLKKDDNIPSLKNLKAILLGGSAIPDSLKLKAISANLPIYSSYGLTEMSSQVATTYLIKNIQQSEQARVLNYREVKISNENEIMVRGRTLFKGYIDGDIISLPLEKDGWFATGDLGSLGGNLLKISGRKDNMFISGGENIRPEEIERFLCQLKEIEQAIVVPVPNEEFGFRPVAFIKESAEGTINLKNVIASLHQRLPKFMTPDQFYNWPANIEEGGIKISRSRLQKLIEDHHPALVPLE